MKCHMNDCENEATVVRTADYSTGERVMTTGFCQKCEDMLNSPAASTKVKARPERSNNKRNPYGPGFRKDAWKAHKGYI